MFLIVTRHQGAVEWLRRQGVEGDVVSHTTPEMVKGRHVIGVLPYGLASLAKSYTALELPGLKPGQRGDELSPEAMDEAGARLVTYRVAEGRDGRWAIREEKRERLLLQAAKELNLKEKLYGLFGRSPGKLFVDPTTWPADEQSAWDPEDWEEWKWGKWANTRFLFEMEEEWANWKFALLTPGEALALKKSRGCDFDIDVAAL